MRFLISVIDTADSTGTQAEMVAIDAFNDELRSSERFIFAWGLTHPREARVIDNRSGLGSVSSGPHHNADEFISGFWIIQTESQDQAKDLAHRASLACNRKVELRELH
jgi:hypothetical protein